ncbi:MAG: RsbRD N-terminal domain-containing protein [Acidobacteriia bacterium]|nr:RsbRD N-terminal domain-containing protein [Terriglobia bacterium]
MLSVRLVQMIEDHSETLTRAVVRELRSSHRLPRLGQLPESELRDRCQEIFKRLGHWLAESDEAEIAAHFAAIAKTRAAQHIPLHEVVLGLQIVKNRILQYARDQGFELTTVELYAEEELGHKVGSFFDAVIYHMVRAYEHELQNAALTASN